MTKSRRSILGLGLRSLTTIGAASLLKNSALAGTNSGADQAVVFINLIGGNDSNNMIVPTSPVEYGAYSRGRGGLAIPRSALLDISATQNNMTFGLHPGLAELRSLYVQGNVAVVANVGHTVQPLTKTSFQSRIARVPNNLFQHTTSDQMRFAQPGYAMPAWTEVLQPRRSAQEKPAEVFAFSSGLSLVPSERSGLEGPGLNNPKLLKALAGAPGLRTQFPATGLGLELQQAVQLVKMAPELGLSRPVISVSLAGFDTHRDQLSQQAALFSTLSQAMAAFYEASWEYGVASRVTTFTDTEFNRALQPNKAGGSEHGWGGHQLVMGAAVKGGVYGDFPSLELGGANDAGTSGVWIPTISRDHYHAAVAGWYGLRPWDIEKVMPGAANFNPSTLGFLA